MDDTMRIIETDEHWRIIAIDTGYNSIGWLTRQSAFRTLSEFAAVRESLIDPFRHLVRRNDMSTIGVKAEVARLPQIGRS